MSGEIKFRIWTGRRFLYWGFIKDGFIGLPESNMESLTPEQKIERCQQFTGLIDKNGKEIYGGDIIKFDDSIIGGLPRSTSPYVGEVVFNTDQALGNIEWGLWNEKGYRSTDFLGEIEIVGNVYENPELVKP